MTEKTKPTGSIRSRLEALEYSDAAIQRIELAQKRMNVPDDDLALGFLLELESYTKLYEDIPTAINNATRSAITRLEAESTNTLNHVLNRISDDWAKRTEKMMDSSLKIKKYTMLVWCNTMLLIVSALSMATYALFNGVIPPYMTNGDITGIGFIDWFIGALHAPMWKVVAIVFLAQLIIYAIRLGMYGQRLKEE